LYRAFAEICDRIGSKTGFALYPNADSDRGKYHVFQLLSINSDKNRKSIALNKGKREEKLGMNESFTGECPYVLIPAK
jgi:hypothetical protein